MEEELFASVCKNKKIFDKHKTFFFAFFLFHICRIIELQSGKGKRPFKMTKNGCNDFHFSRPTKLN